MYRKQVESLKQREKALESELNVATEGNNNVGYEELNSKYQSLYKDFLSV